MDSHFATAHLRGNHFKKWDGRDNKNYTDSRKVEKITKTCDVLHHSGLSGKKWTDKQVYSKEIQASSRLGNF